MPLSSLSTPPHAVRIASEFGFTPASRSRIFSFDQNSLLLENGKPDDNND